MGVRDMRFPEPVVLMVPESAPEHNDNESNNDNNNNNDNNDKK